MLGEREEREREKILKGGSRLLRRAISVLTIAIHRILGASENMLFEGFLTVITVPSHLVWEVIHPFANVKFANYFHFVYVFLCVTLGLFFSNKNSCSKQIGNTSHPTFPITWTLKSLTTVMLHESHINQTLLPYPGNE